MSVVPIRMGRKRSELASDQLFVYCVPTCTRYGYAASRCGMAAVSGQYRM